MTDAEDSPDTRARILNAAVALVARGGPEAATTRAVAAAAGVQPPTLYRLFGDKQGLLDAVAESELATYVAGKGEREPGKDPVADLRRSWDDHLAFCLARPAIFRLMTGAGAGSPAVRAGLEVLRERVRRVARAGRLRVAEERAADLMHAANNGVVPLLLDRPATEQASLADAAREAVLAAVLTDAPVADATPAALASGLRSHLVELAALTPGERLLLDELLRRIAG